MSETLVCFLAFSGAHDLTRLLCLHACVHSLNSMSEVLLKFIQHSMGGWGVVAVETVTLLDELLNNPATPTRARQVARDAQAIILFEVREVGSEPGCIS